MYYTKKSEEVQLRPLILSVIFLFVLIISTFTIVINTPLIYGQTNQTDNADLLNIQDISAKKVHVGDIDIAYKIFGRGNPILLISGSGNVMDVWPTHFLKELALNHTVIIFDNRGVGNTTAGTRPFSIDQFANDTIGLLDALDIQRTDVLGFSMASFIAQKITLTHPERVSRLVLYGASCGGREGIPQTQEVTMTISDLANNRSQNADASLSVTFPPEWIRKNPNYLETIPKTPEIILSTTVVKQFNAVEDWLSRNWTGVCDQLQHISIPTLIITGAEDVAVPAANSLILVQKIPGAWLVQIKAAGHGLMFQYPEKFSEIVKTFLSTTSN
ncbi:MAG: alpha/beta hydrolase [Nitrososphaeraceae archaeon]